MFTYYKKLNIKLSKNNALFQDFRSFDYQHVDLPNNEYDKRNTFKQVKVSLDYFKNEPILEVIEDYNLIPVCFLIESEHTYNWHRDAWRLTAFNLMLNDNPDYLVMFAKDFPIDKSVTLTNMMYTPTISMSYEPRTFYAFNTQIPHISINYGKENRYLLTLAHYKGQMVPGHLGKKSEQIDFLNTMAELGAKGIV